MGLVIVYQGLVRIPESKNSTFRLKSLIIYINWHLVTLAEINKEINKCGDLW